MHPARTRADRPATPTLTTVRSAEEHGRNGVLLLTEAWYYVVHAVNGYAALAVPASTRPDLVPADLKMPGMDDRGHGYRVGR